jgi:hypothetical protein
VGLLSTHTVLTSYSMRTGPTHRLLAATALTLLGPAPPSLPAHRVGFIQDELANVVRRYVAPGLEGHSVISMSPPRSGDKRNGLTDVKLTWRLSPPYGVGPTVPPGLWA